MAFQLPVGLPAVPGMLPEAHHAALRGDQPANPLACHTECSSEERKAILTAESKHPYLHRNSVQEWHSHPRIPNAKSTNAAIPSTEHSRNNPYRQSDGARDASTANDLRLTRRSFFAQHDNTQRAEPRGIRSIRDYR